MATQSIVLAWKMDRGDWQAIVYGLRESDMTEATEHARIYNEKYLVKVKSLSRVRLLATLDCSPPSSYVHGILQTRILEWVAICK